MDPTVLTTVAVAMGAGAAGNVIGKSPITGEQPWNKADLTSEQVMMIGTTASGLWSQGKNLYQFVRGIFKKGLKK
jgi:hypothetical protein